jgi:uncharacterized protein (TIGR02001 family)
MRKTLFTGLSAIAFSTLSAASAQAAELGGGFTVSGSATVVSDYRFRGISQTDRDFAVQGGITVSHESGFYASVWGSSVDDYVAGGSDQEIDLIGGYRHSFGPTTLDVGVLYYYYPGAEDIFPGYNSDFIEPYVSVSHTLGPVTAKLTANYAPKQKALTIGSGKEDNFYLAGDLSTSIPGTPLSASAHLGHSWGPSYLTIGDEYTDWNVGVSYTTGPLTIGVQYVDTDDRLINPLSGKNLSKAGVVGSIGVSF